MPACQGVGCKKPEIIDPTRQCPTCKCKWFLCPACIEVVDVCPRHDEPARLVDYVPLGVQCQGLGCLKPYVEAPTRECPECGAKFFLCPDCIVTIDICPRDFADLTDVQIVIPRGVQCQGIDCAKPYLEDPTRQCPVCGNGYYLCESCIKRGAGAAFCLAHEVPVTLAPISGQLCQGVDCRKPIVPLPTRQCPACKAKYYLCRDCAWMPCARHEELVDMTALADLATPDEVWRSLAHICVVCGRGMGGVGQLQCSGCVAPSDLCARCTICYVTKKGDMCKYCTAAIVQRLQEESLTTGTVQACSSERPPSENEDEPQQTWIYFSNAPFDDFNSGDGSYIDAVVQWIAKNGAGQNVHAVRLCSPARMAKDNIAESATHVPVDYSASWPKDMPATMVEAQEHYAAAQKVVTDWIVEQKNGRPKDRHIFHLQSRFPDSGGIFNATGLKALQAAGVYVVATCHEMKYNFDSLENTQKTLTQLNEYVAVADRVIFLNQHDLSNALKLIAAGSLSAYIDATFARKKEKYGDRYDDLNERFDKLHNEYLKKPQESKVHPSGRMVDKIVVPPSQCSSFFRIPGIATVPGGTLDPNEVLARPGSLLIFGLIRNNTAMKQAAELAAALLDISKVKEMFANAKVYVVGKVMKDVTMVEPITILAERRLSLSQNMRREFKKRCMDLVDATSTAAAFNAKITELLLEYADLKRQALAAYVAARKAFDDLETEIKALAAEYATMKRAEVKPEKEMKENLAKRNTLEKEKRGLQTQLKRATPFDSAPVLPLEIELFVSEQRLREIAATCKYAYKVDQKGMADNASAIVSLVANGCIVFTEAGYDTPNEFRLDKGGDLSPVVMPVSKHDECAAAFVLAEIERRETEIAQASNVRTLKNMIELLEKRYAVDVVGAKHLRVYATLPAT